MVRARTEPSHPEPYLVSEPRQYDMDWLIRHMEELAPLDVDDIVHETVLAAATMVAPEAMKEAEREPDVEAAMIAIVEDVVKEMAPDFARKLMQEQATLLRLTSTGTLPPVLTCIFVQLTLSPTQKCTIM